MQLLIINNVDFTRFIEVPSYRVNEMEIADEWVDGNRVTHKHTIRTQVKGLFTLKFTEIDDFNNFFSVIEANKIKIGDYAGTVIATAYMVNRNDVHTGYYFIEADPQDTLPILGQAGWEGFEVTITEA